MFNQINKSVLPDDVLYEIFKQFISENKLSDICHVNKEWNVVVKNRLMVKHLKKVIENTQEENHKLKVDNYLLTTSNEHINSLYDDLIDTVETFMDLNDM